MIRAENYGILHTHIRFGNWMALKVNKNKISRFIPLIPAEGYIAENGVGKIGIKVMRRAQ